MSNTNYGSEFTSVESVETAFYEAFAGCDLQAMEAVWSNGETSCIHPGSTLITGIERVMQSWHTIFHNAIPPQMSINVLSRYQGKDMAMHVVEERISADEGSHISIVLATNVYKLESGKWKLCMHHASVPAAFQASNENGSEEHTSRQIH